MNHIKEGGYAMFISNQSYDNYDSYFVHDEPHKYIHHRKIQLNTRQTQTLFQFNSTVKLSPLKGLSLVVIFDKTLGEAISFLLESDVILKSQTPFNVLGISNEAVVDLATKQNLSPSTIRLDKELTAKEATKIFDITRVLTTTTYQYQKAIQSSFIQQKFYELLLVELGTYTLTTKDKQLTLTKGDIILLPPQIASKRTAHDTQQTIIHSIKFEANTLSQIPLLTIIDGTTILSPLLDVIHQQNHLLKTHLLTLQLETLLLTIYQQHNSQTTFTQTSTVMRERYENNLFNDIIEYIQQSDIVALKVSDLVQQFNLSRSTLQQLFNKFEKTTPKIYINRIRLEKSRQLIRESNLSITEIADSLGYGSIQYFSRAFSKEFNMTPSEYAKGYAKRL